MGTFLNALFQDLQSSVATDFGEVGDFIAAACFSRELHVKRQK